MIVRDYLALIEAASHVGLLPLWVRVVERSGKVFALKGRLAYRILCL
jgi:hypothetical protein